MTAPLPPDRLRAMARAIDPEVFEDLAQTLEAFGVTEISALPYPYSGQQRLDKALAAAQACWEASPGGELVEALKPFAKGADHYPSLEQGWTDRAGIVGWAGQQELSILRRAREALRQALPQGTET